MPTIADLLTLASPADSPVIAGMPVGYVEAVIEEAVSQIGCRYGDSSERAAALLALHILSLDGSLSAGGSSGQLASEANGPASRSFKTETLAGYASEGLYASTPYGRRLLPYIRSARAVSGIVMRRCGTPGGCV